MLIVGLLIVDELLVVNPYSKAMLSTHQCHPTPHHPAPEPSLDLSLQQLPIVSPRLVVHLSGTSRNQSGWSRLMVAEWWLIVVVDDGFMIAGRE